MMLSPGHTPGHCVVRIDGGDRQLLMIADTLHSADVHTALPDVGFGFDSDPAQAAALRRRILDLGADGQAFGDQHVRDPQALGAQAVIELVVGERHDQLRHASTKSLCRGSYAPVVHDSRNAWQQQRERHLLQVVSLTHMTLPTSDHV